MKILIQQAVNLAIIFCATAALPASEVRSPNVLWIYAEDQSPLLSCYGVDLNVTPVMDQLAADGVRFANAFMPAPVCSAIRSGLMVGAMPTTFGLHNHRSSRTADSMIPLPVEVKTVPELIKQEADFGIQLPSEAPPTTAPELPSKHTVEILPDGTVLLNGGNTGDDIYGELTGLTQMLGGLKASADRLKKHTSVTIQADKYSPHYRSIDVLNACAKVNL